MRKQLTCLLLALCVLPALAQEKKKAVTFDFYGFVRNYFTADTRRNVQSSEGLFNILPLDVEWGADGSDLNKVPQVRFLSITTRLGVNMQGPMIGKAQSSAKIEADFCGNGFNVRLRQAYVRLAWQQAHTDLLVGQAWHPMAGDLMPEVFSLATGSPFNPFNRSPQVRCNYQPVPALTLTAAALYQFQYNSVGIDNGKVVNSNVFSRHAMYPELFFGLTAKGGGFTGGIGADASVISPRVEGKNAAGEKVRVHEFLPSVSAMAFASYKYDDLSIRAKAVYGQNTSHLLQPSGYGITAEQANGKRTYAPLQSGSAWLTMMYGKNLRYGFFAGYFKNFGTAGHRYLTDTPILMRGGQMIDQACRLTPLITYRIHNFQVGLELEYTAAAFGKVAVDGTVGNTHWVDNNRACVMVKYDF